LSALIHHHWYIPPATAEVPFSFLGIKFFRLQPDLASIFVIGASLMLPSPLQMFIAVYICLFAQFSHSDGQAISSWSVHVASTKKKEGQVEPRPFNS